MGFMFEKIDQFFLRVAALLLTIVMCYVVFKFATATGQIEYCYVASHISSGGQVYTLNGRRFWRPDETILRETVFPTRTVEYAKEIGCQLKLVTLLI